MRILANLLLVALAVSETTFGQADTSKRSHVQWLNATSADPVEFVLNRTTLSRSWSPGQRLGAGIFPSVDWSAQLKPAEPLEPARFELNLQDGESAAAVFIGDFKEVKDGELNPRRLPPGYIENPEGKAVRVGLVKLPVGKGRAANYPVYLLNGIPDEKVRVEVVGGQAFDLEYGVPQSFQAKSGSAVKVKFDGSDEPVEFNVDDTARGGLFTFYRRPGKDATEFGFMRLQSIESLNQLLTDFERVQQEEAASE
jgi:hypothetical protein